ncbi:MAG: hypothetical protein ACRDBR_01405 [Metamycoplasmataceae bacterium]
MKRKNLFLGLTTLAIVASPIVATISCGENSSNISPPPPSLTVLDIQTKTVSQAAIDAFTWNDGQSAGEKITNLSTIFVVNINETNINNFTVNINSQANPKYVELTAKDGFTFSGNQKTIKTTTEPVQEKPMINVQNKMVTSDSLYNSQLLPVFSLGFSEINDQEGSYLNYKIENQVYNFRAEVHIDPYQITYNKNIYNVSSLTTALNFDFMFTPDKDKISQGGLGFLKLIGNNSEYKIGQGGLIDLNDVPNGSTSGKLGSIITTAEKGLGNSFFASKEIPPMQMQFQIGLVADVSWGLRLAIWPYTDENSKNINFNDCWITKPQSEKPGGGMPQMSATYSIIPKIN